MRRNCLVIAAVLCTLTASGLAMIAAPVPRIFASEMGTTALKVIPKAPTDLTNARGVLFELKADGGEKVLWDKQLVNLPGHVLIYDLAGARYVVTLDGWGNAGGPNSVVIYAGDGKVVASINSSAITGPLPAGPIAADGGRSWQKGATVYMAPPRSPRLQVTLTDDRVVEIELETGKILPAGK